MLEEKINPLSDGEIIEETQVGTDQMCIIYKISLSASLLEEESRNS
jgi:hypothetical protein